MDISQPETADRAQAESPDTEALLRRILAVVEKDSRRGGLELALAIILQLLFGNNTQFVGDVAGNIMGFIKAFGGQGLVGLIAIGVVLYILNRN